MTPVSYPAQVSVHYIQYRSHWQGRHTKKQSGYRAAADQEPNEPSRPLFPLCNDGKLRDFASGSALCDFAIRIGFNSRQVFVVFHSLIHSTNSWIVLSVFYGLTGPSEAELRPALFQILCFEVHVH